MTKAPMPYSAMYKHATQAVSEQTACVVSAVEVRLLTEIGFLAAGNGFTKPALQIFAALKLVRPDSAFPIIGQAVALLNRGITARAVKLLEDAKFTNKAEQQEINAWLGFALQQSRHHALATRALKLAAYQNPELSNTYSAKMAQALLERNISSAPVPYKINTHSKQAGGSK